MPQNTRVFVRGPELYRAIVAMSAPTLKYVVASGVSFQIDKEMARVMVKTGQFEGLLRRNRIVKIRDLDSRKPNIHDHTFRDGRAMLQFTPITNKTVKIWDRYLKSKNPPPPVINPTFAVWCEFHE